MSKVFLNYLNNYQLPKILFQFLNKQIIVYKILKDISLKKNNFTMIIMIIKLNYC